MKLTLLASPGLARVNRSNFQGENWPTCTCLFTEKSRTVHQRAGGGIGLLGVS